MTVRVTMYATAYCPYCMMAERLLLGKGVEIDKIRVDLEPQRRIEMVERTRRRTVPQIYIGDHHVGGCDELYALEREGKLDALLAAGAQ
jgi:glutaredoxin 3